MRIRWEIARGISEQTLVDIHGAMLSILAQTGLRIFSPDLDDRLLRDRLGGTPGVRFAGDRAYFASDLVESLLDEYRQDHAIDQSWPEDTATIPAALPSHVFYILDPACDAFRPCDRENLALALRLARAFADDGVSGICPGYPSEAPVALRELARFKLNSECGGSLMMPHPYESSSRDRDPRVYQYLQEMSAVIDGNDHPFANVVGVHPISPLRLEGDEFDNALYLWRTELGDRMQVSIGNMPIAGVSAPVDFPSAFAQSIAEAVGSWLFFRLFLGRGHAEFAFNIYPFDMKYGSFAYGAPEDLIVAMARRELYAYYHVGANWADKALHTMAHAPDTQAAGEKAPKVLGCLLAGAKRFSGIGGLCLDEGWSPEQMVIDLEILHWARHVARGVESTGIDMAARVAEGIANGGDFLSLESTLLGYRESFWMPELFEHTMKSVWEHAGGKTVRETARAKIAVALRQEPFMLSDDKRIALEEIYHRAEIELANARR